LTILLATSALAPLYFAPLLSCVAVQITSPSLLTNRTEALASLAVAAYTKINANGQWIERSEHVSLNELFDRMTPQEMESYAANGTLPTWFERTLGATPTNSQGGSNVQ
jgi:hypothetical protein